MNEYIISNLVLPTWGVARSTRSVRHPENWPSTFSQYQKHIIMFTNSTFVQNDFSFR